MNALSLALTYLWKRPLPEVLRQYVMDPIGASNAWHWEGYDNSWITIDGKRIQAVPGGGHWGGGMFISALDLARMGLLGLKLGKWGNTQILSPKWIAHSRTPTGPNPEYGYMNWFLNTDQKLFPAARADTGRLHRQWRQHRLHRLRARHRRGGPLDRRRAEGGVCAGCCWQR